ncbi:hypothetical protein TD95_002696 [Thielaviopsis punctulata]|uniref:Uncharacterized protein n=1 Tax=Thielaviopsis punctulata TaxID=72032 RepID=A0A0F4ZFY2_9PEZI|nr:hypothetical protein TD95_002696 [Thielaviopsis punctulata]
MGFFSADSSSRRPRKHAVPISRRPSHYSAASSSQRGRRDRSSSPDRDRSRSRSRGPAASIAGSLFNLASGGSRGASGFFAGSGNNASRASFFGASRPSYYKRSSRPGFMVRAYRHLKRILRDILHWAKRHPIKVFMLVLLPLITSGALVALLARFGLRIPATIERWIRTGARAASGDTFGAMNEAVRMASGRGLSADAATVRSMSSMASTTRSVVDGPAGKTASKSIWSSAVKFFTD